MPDTPSTPADGLAGLKKMSTTAGLGDDYAELDPLAVAALAVGVLSLVVILLPWMAFLPLIGLVLAAASVYRIRKAGGTRTGLPVALVGGALCLATLALGGWSLGADRRRTSADAAAIERVAADFGEHLAAGDAASAYRLLHPTFRRGVDGTFFAEVMQGFGRVHGQVAGASTSGRYLFERGERNVAETQLLIDLPEGTFRVKRAIFVETDNGWRLLTLPEIFPGAGADLPDEQEPEEG